jgi:integrase
VPLTGCLLGSIQRTYFEGLPVPKLTKTLVEQATVADRDTYLWDSALTGFGVKITPKGRRVYIVQYRPKGQLLKTRRYTIGAHGSPWMTEAARDAASTLLARVRLGEDPFQVDKLVRQHEATEAMAKLEREARAVRERFSLIVEEFIRMHAKVRNRRWDEAERILTSDDLEGWQERPLSSITKRDILGVVDEATARAHGAGRLLFAWCVERLYIEQSPFAGLKGPKPSKARDRTLSDQEIALIWAASHRISQPYGAIVRLLLLTGQRRGEVTGMTWGELDLSTREWTIPAKRAKNEKSHLVDLSEPALFILNEAPKPAGATTRTGPMSKVDCHLQSPMAATSLVFASERRTPISNHSQSKATLDDAIVRIRCEREPSLDPAQARLNVWRLHDLRRTAATGMARLGHPPHVVEAVLNHRSGVRGGLVAVYQHYDLRAERRAALEDWGRHIDQIAGKL